MKKIFFILLVILLLIIFVGCRGRSPWAVALDGSSNQTFQIKVEVDGAGEVIGTGEYEDGDKITLIAKPEDGHMFLGWYLGDYYITRELEMEVLVLQNFDMLAKFRKIE